MANLVTLRDVELCGVGTWELSTGSQTFTADDFAAAVAAQDDSAVRSPIVKLGHTDPRFDGEPAIGRVINMRCSANGQTLIGDIAGVPAGIAEIWGSAWPSRSIEATYQFRTATGHTHAFVVTGLALLGAALPGVENLADIAALYDVAAASAAAGVPVTVTLTAEEAPMTVTAGAIRAHTTDTTTGAWSAATQVSHAGDSATDLRAMHAWVDPSGTDTAKASYSLPHHEVASDGTVGAANVKGVTSAIAALNGARGGSAIPADDQAKVHAHLAKHLRDSGVADDDIPELKASGATTAAAAGFANATTCTDCAHKASFHNDRQDSGANSGACQATGCDCKAMAGVKASRSADVAAGVAVEDVRRAYYDSTGPRETWWWIRSIYIDPPELIVDDDEDDLYRIGYSLDDSGAVTFGDAIPVQIVYVDVADDTDGTVSAGAPPLRAAAAQQVFASRAESRPQPSPSASTGPTGQKGASVDLSKMRSALGLAEDATDDDVIAAALTRFEAPAPEPAPVPAPTIPAMPDGVTMIDEATLEDLKVAAAAGRAAHDRQRTDDRERYLDSAARAGKFPPARREFWTGYYDRDSEGARGFLDQVAAGSAVPLTEAGHPGTGEGQRDDTADDFAALAKIGSSVAADVVARTIAARGTDRKDA